MQGVAVIRFTHELSLWDPEMFVRSVLVDWLHVAEVWVGANFLFGHERAGTFSVLRSLGARYGFRAEKIDPVRYKDFVVSSTRVRRLVTEGRVDEAGALLGHHYFLDGTVARGAGRGRELGFPTANLETANELLPPAGVYATAAAIGGTVYPAITNVGTRPTFGDVDHPIVETHIFGLNRDLYDAPLRLSFVQRLQGRAGVSRRGCPARANRGGLPQRQTAVRAHFAVESWICHSGPRLRPTRWSGCRCRSGGSFGGSFPTWRRKSPSRSASAPTSRRWRSRSTGSRRASRPPPRTTRRSTFVFRQAGGDLLIEAHCGGRSSEVRCPLAA